jgi:hypothetical protein
MAIDDLGLARDGVLVVDGRLMNPIKHYFTD